MDRGSITLVVEPGPDDTKVSIAALDCEYHSIGLLGRRPRVFRLELQDAARPVRWDPQGDELSWAGRTFAAFVGQLYDGNHWRLNLDVSLFRMVHENRESLVGGYDCEPPWEWFVERMKDKHLSMAFWLTEPWLLSTVDDAAASSEEHRWYHWWCPKGILRETLTQAWDWNCKGYLAPRSELSSLAQCLAVADFADRLDGLLDICKFVFQGSDHGSKMILLSRTLSLADVTAAAQHLSVERALRGLEKAASTSSAGGTVNMTSVSGTLLPN